MTLEALLPGTGFDRCSRLRTAWSRDFANRRDFNRHVENHPLRPSRAVPLDEQGAYTAEDLVQNLCEDPNTRPGIRTWDVADFFHGAKSSVLHDPNGEAARFAVALIVERAFVPKGKPGQERSGTTQPSQVRPNFSRSDRLVPEPRVPAELTFCSAIQLIAQSWQINRYCYLMQNGACCMSDSHFVYGRILKVDETRKIIHPDKYALLALIKNATLSEVSPLFRLLDRYLNLKTAIGICFETRHAAPVFESYCAIPSFILRANGSPHRDTRRYRNRGPLRSTTNVSFLDPSSEDSLYLHESQIAFSIFGRHNESWSAYQLKDSYFDGAVAENVGTYAAEAQEFGFKSDPLTGDHDATIMLGAPEHFIRVLQHILEITYPDWEEVVTRFIDAWDLFEVLIRRSPAETMQPSSRLSDYICQAHRVHHKLRVLHAVLTNFLNNYASFFTQNGTTGHLDDALLAMSEKEESFAQLESKLHDVLTRRPAMVPPILETASRGQLETTSRDQDRDIATILTTLNVVLIRIGLPCGFAAGFLDVCGDHVGNDPVTFVVANFICLLFVNAVMSPLGRRLWRSLKAVGMWTTTCAAAAWQGFARATGRPCACVWHVFRMATIGARHVLCSLFRHFWSAFRSIQHHLSHTQNRSEMDLEAGDSRSPSLSTGTATNTDPIAGGLISPPRADMGGLEDLLGGFKNWPVATRRRVNHRNRDGSFSKQSAIIANSVGTTEE